MKNNLSQHVEDWLLKLPLYQEVDLDGQSQNAAKDLHLYSGTFDAYCTGCNKVATFQAELTSFGGAVVRDFEAGFDIEWQTDIIQKEANCTRQDHKLMYFFVINELSLVKIGQIPSLADIATSETVYFKSVLSRSQLQELNKGIGLAAHGVGVGSYVYLRRVFESLIEEAHQLAITDQAWSDETYHKSRMKEKIQLLSHHLPDFLVQHPVLYSILSKGVHELTEQECLANFDKLKIAIFVIAEEKVAELKKQKRITEASRFLAS